MSGGKVVVFDTKHGTQRYGLKLGLLVTRDHNGMTRILAVSLVTSEDIPPFSWVFEEFEKAFGAPPLVLFTDSDGAMASAIEAKWLTTTHLLCTWHLWKNFYEHIHHLFMPGKAAEWRVLAGMWWKLCKNSDESAQETFDSDWGAIVTYIEANAVPSVANKIPSAKKPEETEMMKQKAWLATMAKRKEMWAACFTWAFCTYGIHSTQCIEAIHSAIAQWCNVPMLLTRLLDSLDKHELMRVECSASNAHRVAFRRAGQLAAGVEPHVAVQSPQRTLTANAYELLCAQAAQSIHYSCEEIVSTMPEYAAVAASPNRYYIAKRMDKTPPPIAVFAADDAVPTDVLNDEFGLAKEYDEHLTSNTDCSCQMGRSLKIPCRHTMRVITQESKIRLPEGCISSFWNATDESEIAATAKRVAEIRSAAAVPVRKSAAERTNELTAKFKVVAALAGHRQDWSQACDWFMESQLAMMRAAAATEAGTASAASAAAAAPGGASAEGAATAASAPMAEGETAGAAALVANPPLPGSRQKQ